MDEQLLQEKLKQNIPTADEFTPAIQPVQTEFPNGSDVANDVESMTEMMQYKLSDFFGETYRPNDEIKKQQMKYIYEKVLGMVESPEYGFIVEKLNVIVRILGLTNSEQKVYKVYQWLKLDSMKKNIDKQMEAIHE